ncbi:MAG: FecR family protein [Spirochaetota bacterium]
MKNPRRSMFMALVLVTVTSQAQEAVFSEVSGKVEYQLPGADWKPAKVGSKVSKGSLVSTGFKSTAVLKIGKISISMKPITRLSLDELVKTAGGTQTELYLLSGRVHADVPPQAGQTSEFNVTSPTATASVRGTAFLFDGTNLLVDRGTVKLMTPTSQSRSVGMGEFSYVVKGSGNVAPPIAVVVEPTPIDNSSDTTESSDTAAGDSGGDTSATASSGDGGGSADASGGAASTDSGSAAADSGGAGGGAAITDAGGSPGGGGPADTGGAAASGGGSASSTPAPQAAPAATSKPAAAASKPAMGGAMLERVHAITVQATVEAIAQKIDKPANPIPSFDFHLEIK